MATAIPAFVRSMFNTFPLIRLPPLGDTENPLTADSKLPTLYIVKNDPKSISAQMFLQLNSFGHVTRILAPEANEGRPYLVIPRLPGQIISGAVDECCDFYDEQALLNHIASTTKADQPTEEESGYISLVNVILANAWTLATFLDTQDNRTSISSFLTDYGVRKLPDDIQYITGEHHSWVDLLRKYKFAIKALDDKLSKVEDDHFSASFNALLYGHVHCTFVADDNENEGRRILELRNTIKKHQNVVTWYTRFSRQNTSTER